MAVLGLHWCAGFSLAVVSRACSRWGPRASLCFSCCGARALGASASVVEAPGLSSCGSWALEHGLSSCSVWATLFQSMWDLSGPEIKPGPPASAGGFFTTEPPRKPRSFVFKVSLPYRFHHLPCIWSLLGFHHFLPKLLGHLLQGRSLGCILSK